MAGGAGYGSPQSGLFEFIVGKGSRPRIFEQEKDTFKRIALNVGQSPGHGQQSAACGPYLCIGSK